MTPELLTKLTDFIQKFLPYEDRDLIKEYLAKHNDFKTLLYALDDKQEVIGLVRFNAFPATETGEILDFAIRPDWRNKGLFKNFVKRALKIWPTGKYLTFVRKRKYPDREQKKIPIDFILKHNL